MSPRAFSMLAGAALAVVFMVLLPHAAYAWWVQAAAYTDFAAFGAWVGLLVPFRRTRRTGGKR
ncbi:MAG: hypothetical protein JO362_06110 [Streptomycetaceae bacterium]|nr:hypothetical protein [Streptomycetaceae bacterium]